MLAAKKRSPSYPRVSLDRAVEMARRVYESAYEAPVDTSTVFSLMGYSGKSGPSAGALAALKQYGLIDGRDQSLRITPLALRIIHPANDYEKTTALTEAVFSPQFYSEIMQHFGDKIPSEQVLKSFLVRSHGFNPNGADELIRVLKDNRPHMERLSSRTAQSSDEGVRGGDVPSARPFVRGEADVRTDPISRAELEDNDERREILRFRVSPTCFVRISFTGPVSRSAIERTIQYLELAKDEYADR